MLPFMLIIRVSFSATIFIIHYRILFVKCFFKIYFQNFFFRILLYRPVLIPVYTISDQYLYNFVMKSFYAAASSVTICCEQLYMVSANIAYPFVGLFTNT